MKRMSFILIILFCILLVLFVGINDIDSSNIAAGSVNTRESKFYATIKSISEYNGSITLNVEGLNSNDVNHRGEFSFNINKTQVLWKSSMVSKSYLKEGMLILIGEYSAVQEIYPARLVDVKQIIIIQDTLDI